MSTSITAVNAKLIADAKQFIAEFERANAATKKSATGIDSELDSLQKKIKKKFSAGDIGRDLMKGLGIGGGFEVARLAADQLVEIFKREAEQAKAIEESTAKQLEYTKQIIALRQSPAQQEAAARAAFERAGRELETARRGKVITETGMDGSYKPILRSRTLVDTESVAALDAEYKRLAVEVEKYNKVVRDDAVTAALDAKVQKLDSEKKLYADLEKGYARVRDQVAKGEEEMTSLIEKTKDAADPWAEASKEIEKINLLLQAQKITELEAIEARQKAWEKSGLLKNNKSGVSIENDDLTDMAKYAEEASHAAEELGMTFASAFEDAIVSGNKLSDVLQGLAQDVMRLFIRQTVTKPLADSLSSTFADWNLFRADGGPVSGSSPYIVGERGPELFVPSSNGTIVPNHALSSRSSSSNIYQIDARGTDESVVQRLQSAMFALAGPGVVERRALSANVSAMRRGGGMGRALQGA